MKVTFDNFQLLADKELYEAMVEKYGTQPYRNTGKIAIKTNNSFASFMIAEKVGDKYKITPITSQNNERQSLQMEAYWTVLKEFPISEFNDVPQFYKQWFRNRDLIKEVIQKRLEDRDYKDEYKKFQSSKKSKKYRAELNKYNRDKGTYGNGDGKDASHKNGKISGFEKSSTNKGRREKSRLKKESTMKEKFYIATKSFWGDTGRIKKGDIFKSDGKVKVGKRYDDFSNKEYKYKYVDIEDANPNVEYYEEIDPAEFKTLRLINLKKDAAATKKLKSWKYDVHENKMKITRERLREIIVEEYQKLNEQRISDEVATALVKSKKIKKGMSEDDMMPIISAYVKKKYPKSSKRLLSYDRDFWADTISAISYELKGK